jgi:hypothetical protein
MHMSRSPFFDFQSQLACPSCAWSNNTSFGRFTCVKCGTALPREDKNNEAEQNDTVAHHDFAPPEPLQYPFAREMPFEDGRVAAEVVAGVERHMDYTTYEVG